MTEPRGIHKGRTGPRLIARSLIARSLIAWAAAIGLLAGSVLMPMAHAALPAAGQPAPAAFQITDEHAGHEHARGPAAHDHEGHESRGHAAPADMPDFAGCGLCSDCMLCAMGMPVTAIAMASEYPPAGMRGAETSLPPGIALPPPAEPPRV
ncbi:MAG: hypothetical protein ACK4FK_10435 [Ferrovibrio sp.]|uniref:hypothetical protein n=1 Tax=Ferrovibrio sp. TaxID=1917215 RepID=UPI00391B7319